MLVSTNGEALLATDSRAATDQKKLCIMNFAARKRN